MNLEINVNQSIKVIIFLNAFYEQFNHNDSILFMGPATYTLRAKL